MNTPLEILAEPRRQAILRLVWDRERTAGEITAAFNVSFSAISQHLARMKTAKVVTVRREGRRRHYRANKKALGPLAVYLETIWRGRLKRLKRLAETEERNATHENE